MFVISNMVNDIISTSRGEVFTLNVDVWLEELFSSVHKNTLFCLPLHLQRCLMTKNLEQILYFLPLY